MTFFTPLRWTTPAAISRDAQHPSDLLQQSTLYHFNLHHPTLAPLDCDYSSSEHPNGPLDLIHAKTIIHFPVSFCSLSKTIQYLPASCKDHISCTPDLSNGCPQDFLCSTDQSQNLNNSLPKALLTWKDVTSYMSSSSQHVTCPKVLF